MRLSPDDPKLSAYHDGMLDARGMRLIQQALHDNPAVRDEYTALRRTVDHLQGLPDPEPPPHFWPDTYQRLRDSARSGQCRRPVREAIRGVVMVLLMIGLLGGAVALARARGALGEGPPPAVHRAAGITAR